VPYIHVGLESIRGGRIGGGRRAGGVDDRGSGGGRPRGSGSRRRRWRRCRGGAGRTARGHRRMTAAKTKDFARRRRRNCSDPGRLCVYIGADRLAPVRG